MNNQVAEEGVADNRKGRWFVEERVEVQAESVPEKIQYWSPK